MTYLKKFFLLLIILCGLFSSYAQNEISNPYSGFGIGIINKYSNAILDGMGGVSYAMQNPYYIALVCGRCRRFHLLLHSCRGIPDSKKLLCPRQLHRNRPARYPPLAD